MTPVFSSSLLAASLLVIVQYHRVLSDFGAYREQPSYYYQRNAMPYYPNQPSVPMAAYHNVQEYREPILQEEEYPYAFPEPECKNKDLEANKRVGMGFYQEVWGNKQFHLVEKYLAPDVINHNPHEVNGRQSVLDMLQGPMGDGPPVKVQFQRVSAEGDLVWIHNRLPIPAINKTYSIVDIFRIDCNGMIAEKWDVMQDTDVETKNPVAFF